MSLVSINLAHMVPLLISNSSYVVVEIMFTTCSHHVPP